MRGITSRTTRPARGPIAGARTDWGDQRRPAVALLRAGAVERPGPDSQGALFGLTNSEANHGEDVKEYYFYLTRPDGRPYSRVHVSRVFRKASQGAGLRGFTFHDLRHHGATMALNRGFSAPIVQALGGWKTERMMKRYAAVTDQTLRAAAEAVSGNEIGVNTAIRR
jgi:integrase